MKRKTPMDPQLALPMPRPRGPWGGRREGAGRKPTGKAKGLPHRARPWHDANHPVHVTLRVSKRLGSLRRYGVAAEIMQAFREAAAQQRGSFPVAHLSIPPDHLHRIGAGGDKVTPGPG